MRIELLGATQPTTSFRNACGSQHDPQFDAAEIDLAQSDGHAADRPFAISLIPTSPDRGRLVIVWGPHEWTADFSY